jgi:microcystin degradation protein MlrC
MSLRIFAAGLATETNTFSPIATDRHSFEQDFYFPAGTLPPERLSSCGALHALHERAASDGLTILQGLYAATAPSAAVRSDAYTSLREQLLADLHAALPVQAVLLDLHGAMVAEGCDDCEGDLLSRVRAIVGTRAASGVVVGVALDPHCHLTEAMFAHADLMTMFKEYPHTDVLARGRELVDMALRTLRGTLRPRLSRFDCRMAGLYHTHRQPMRGFIDRIRALEGRGTVQSISIAHGFPWADVPDMGTQVLVVTDGDAPGGDALARRLGRELIALRGRTSEPHVDAASAVRLALAEAQVPGLLVFGDCADNPGAGAPGDSTHLLRAFIEAGVAGVAAGLVCDPGAVALACRAGQGATLDLRIGGKVAATSGMPLDLRVTVLSVDAGAWQEFAGARQPLGTLVALRAGGLTLLVCSVRVQCLDAGVFGRAGVDLAACKVVLVKSMQHFQAAFAPLARRVVYTSTPGTHPFDLKSIAYRRVRRPLWPLDDGSPLATEAEAP